MIRHLPFGLWLLVLALFGIIAGCSTPQQSSSAGGGGYYKDDGPGSSPPGNLHAVPNASPRIEQHAAANMRPYTVFGKRYVPQSGEQPFRQTGAASWYGKKFHGRKTANGEIYDMYAMTAAHPTLPLPSYAKVTRPKTGQSVIVRINDRGPFHGSRIIDLSYVAAAKLGLIEPGSDTVIVEAITHDDIRNGSYTDGGGSVAASTPVPNYTPDAIEALAQSQLAAHTTNTSGSGGLGLETNASSVNTAFSNSSLSPISGSNVPRIYLQFGAFSASQSANALAEQINQKTRQIEYRSAHIEPADDLYRVQIGPYETRTEAINAALRIEQETGLPASLAVR